MLSEISQRQIPCDITYMWNLKYDTNLLIYKTEIDSQSQETNLWLPKRKGEKKDKLGIWDQQMETTMSKNKQYDPTVQQREIYSITCNKPLWTITYIYIYI